MPRERATDEELDRKIRRLVAGGMTSGIEVYRQLVAEGDIPEDGAPSAKTIQRRVRDLLGSTDPSPWSALDADPDQARLVTPVLWWLFQQSGTTMWLSKSLARWVARVRAVDDMPPDWAYGLAAAFEGAEVRGEADRRCLDLWIASRPWDILDELVELDLALKIAWEEAKKAAATEDEPEPPEPVARSAEGWATYLRKMRGYCVGLSGEAGARQYHDVGYGLHGRWQPVPDDTETASPEGISKADG